MILATSSSRAAAQVRRASGKTVAPFRSAKAPLRVQQRLESRRYAAAAEVETDSKPGAYNPCLEAALCDLLGLN